MITAWARLADGAAPAGTSANLTVKRSDRVCPKGTCFDTIGAFEVPVTDSGWSRIGGTYKVSVTETGLQLYAQIVGADAPTGFYLDDVVISETAPPPTAAPLAAYNFQDGGLDGWAPFGSVTLTNAAPPIPDPNGDAQSLLVTNRTAGYMGPSLDLLSLTPALVAGGTYQITAYVLLAAPDPGNPTATISTKLTNCANASGTYGNVVTSGPLSNTSWTQVTGTFSFSNVPGPPSTMVLYIQSSSATDSFYIDAVSISQLAGRPASPGQQDNSGIVSDFEDGGLDGWNGRAGSSQSNSTAEAHGGTNSLLTTGRVANYDGPQINVSNKIFTGSVYSISVWVKLLATDGASHVMNMSLQTSTGGNNSYLTVTPYPGVTVIADGNWHQISVSKYNMATNYDAGTAYLYLQTVPKSGTDLVSFYIDDFQLTYIAPPMVQTGIPSIYQTLAAYFPIGAAIGATDLTGAHAQLLTQHFNSIVSGNDMKWSSVEITKGTYSFANADAQVGLASCTNMLVRGHNLVWATGDQTPAYAFGDGTNSPANQATVTANIQEHIQTEVSHFGSAVYVWDVINEPLDANQPDCLFHGPFYKVLGKSYIDIALQAARQYAPGGTKLFINDYSTFDPKRLACLTTVLQDLQSRGIPIDGIGHETHNQINYPSTAAMVSSINTLAAQFPGLDQQITEMDESVYTTGQLSNAATCAASDYNVTNNGVVPAALLAEQGWLYWQYFAALRQLQGKISAVTIWGTADDDTWLSSFPCTHLDLPLAFDTGLQAKAAYWGIVDATQLPGYGLTFAVTSKSGDQNARTWTITASNPSSGTAYATQIMGFTLRQTAGAACAAVVTSPGAFSLGDIAAGNSASATFLIDFTSGCDAVGTTRRWPRAGSRSRGGARLAAFDLNMPWSSAVYNTGTLAASGQSQ